MEQSKHTPGRWLLDLESGVVTATKGNFSFEIAAITQIPAMFSNVIGKQEEETIANARLIAAAPDLLAALQYVLDGCAGIFGTDQETGDTFDAIIRAAIAKAEQS